MLNEDLRHIHIILASQSPRRKELLSGIGIQFDTLVIKGIDESIPENMPHAEAAEYLALKKADAYTGFLDEKTIIITADTIVCTEDAILNKPADFDDARRMLNALSGKQHEVITGVCISTQGRRTSFSASTKVRFAELSSEEIDFYISTYKPYDKAGAYGIQEWIGYIGIESIEGSYFNVVGLPVQKLYAELKKFMGE